MQAISSTLLVVSSTAAACSLAPCESDWLAEADLPGGRSDLLGPLLHALDDHLELFTGLGEFLRAQRLEPLEDILQGTRNAAADEPRQHHGKQDRGNREPQGDRAEHHPLRGGLLGLLLGDFGHLVLDHVHGGLDAQHHLLHALHVGVEFAMRLNQRVEALL